MGRRDPVEKKEARARHAARRLTTLRGMKGVVWFEPGRLWVLRPAEGSPRTDRVASALCGDSLPARAAFAQLIGASEQACVGKGELTEWARAVVELESRRDLEALIAEGVRPLRRYRNADVRRKIAEYRQRLELLGRLLQDVDAATQLQEADSPDEVPPATVLRALSLRLYALGRWAVDPVELLSQPSFPAGAELRRFAEEESDPALRELARLLLVLRGAGDASSGPCFAPCLQALVRARTGGDVADAGLPDDRLEHLAEVGHRVALLYGESPGRAAFENLAGPSRPVGEARKRLLRFYELVKAFEDGRRPEDAGYEDRQFLDDLKAICDRRVDPARELVDLFFGWMSRSGQVRLAVSRRTLAQRVRTALAGGLRSAAVALRDAWEESVRQAPELAGLADWATLKARLQLSLLLPEGAPPVPGVCNPELLRQLIDAFAALPRERVRELWGALSADAGFTGRSRLDWFELPLLKLDLPATLIARCLRNQVRAEVAELFLGNPQALGRYLDCLESLRPVSHLQSTLEGDWFASMFLGNRAWAPAVVLATLVRARSGKTAGDGRAELFELSRSLSGAGPLAQTAAALEQALAEWSEPAAPDPPPELGELADLLQVSRESLQRYLHLRRLAGHGQTFAEGLLEPLRAREKDAREAAFLEGQLSDPGLEPRRREHLAARLARLRDPALTDARLRDCADRARKRFDRSLPLLEHESLERVIDGVYARYLRDFLRRDVPLPLPPGFREALHLIHSDRIDHELLSGFLLDVLDGRSVLDRAPNRAWLERARSSGVDTGAWLAGLSVTAGVNGVEVTFRTERDPLHVLKMGSYFETCLTLESGINAASTLVNALDVNKQVIYGRRADGTVVARKLIVATARGELAGFHTYAHEAPEVYRERLGAILADFAARCRLQLSDTATPEVLHSGFWYNDGNEPWPRGPLTQALRAPPGDAPADPAAVSEWNFVDACLRGDREALLSVARFGAGENPDWRVAAKIRLAIDHGETPEVDPESRGSGAQEVIEWLTGADRLPAGLYRDWHGWAAVPGSLTRLRQRLRSVTLARPPADEHELWNVLRLPTFGSRLSVGELVEFLARACRRADPKHLEYMREHIERHWVGLLQVAWLREGDAAPLARALEEAPPIVERVIVELARLEVMPRLAPRLRKMLKEGADNVEQVALALGTQQDPQDGPRLLELLRERRDSLAVAVAVVRTGNAQAAQLAREIWQPPVRFDRVLNDPVWVGRARELGSIRLAQAIAKTARREARRNPEEWSDPLPTIDNLGNAALLALPEPEGDFGTLIADLEGNQLYRQITHRFTQQRGRVKAAAAIRELPEMKARLEQGEARSLEALAWWQQARAACTFGGREMLTDDAFERGVRRLAARGGPAQRTAALAAWLGQTPAYRRGALAGQLLGLFDGDNEPSLDQRRVVLGAMEESTDWWFFDAWEAALTWLEGLPVEEQRRFLGPMRSLFLSLDDYLPTWLLGVEGPSPRRAAAIEAFLGACASSQPDAAVACLNTAMARLAPAAAGRLAGRILPELEVLSLSVNTLLGYVDAQCADVSYRLQKAIITHVWPRLEQAGRDQVRAHLQTRASAPRVRWLLGLIGTA